MENISEVPPNKVQEIKKLLAKSLNKKISVEKVGDQDRNTSLTLINSLVGLERSD